MANFEVMVLNNTYINNIQLYRGDQLHWWRKPEYPEKTTDIPRVTDKLYHVRDSNSQL